MTTRSVQNTFSSGSFKLLLLCSFGLLVEGCGGDSESDAAPSNAAPTIAGTPPSQALVGALYSFMPTAADPDGNTLQFKVENLPAWATFDADTGLLSGTPEPKDVGTFPDIVISVSDGTATATLKRFSVDVVASGPGSVLLTWVSPTQNVDGTSLTNLEGFKIYWGTEAGNFPHSVMLNNPGLTSYVIDQLTPATWYFVAAAVNSEDVESMLSNVASKTIQ